MTQTGARANQPLLREHGWTSRPKVRRKREGTINTDRDDAAQLQPKRTSRTEYWEHKPPPLTECLSARQSELFQYQFALPRAFHSNHPLYDTSLQVNSAHSLATSPIIIRCTSPTPLGAPPTTRGGRPGCLTPSAAPSILLPGSPIRGAPCSG